VPERVLFHSSLLAAYCPPPHFSQGAFSRLDYQRNPQARKNGIETFTTRLPAAASDVYYRDVIGNISTSHLREEENAVLVEIQPRFPLFGGWKTHYTVGYTMPTYEVLFTSAKGFHVNMRFVVRLAAMFSAWAAAGVLLRGRYSVALFRGALFTLALFYFLFNRATSTTTL
jgi:hypothetical protein